MNGEISTVVDFLNSPDLFLKAYVNGEISTVVDREVSRDTLLAYVNGEISTVVDVTSNPKNTLPM